MPDMRNYISHDYGFIAPKEATMDNESYPAPVAPIIDDPRVVEQPFSLQVQRYEFEAYGMAVDTFFGKRLLRLFRREDVLVGECWGCHPNNEDPFGLWGAYADTAEQAVKECLRRLSV